MPQKYRIERVTFSDRSTVELPNLTVLIGPNNCGKSRALKDILGLTCGSDWKPFVVQEATATYPIQSEILRSEYRVNPIQDSNGAWAFHYLDSRLKSGVDTGVGPAKFDQIVAEQRSFRHLIAPQLTAFLMTETRLTMVQEAESPANHRSITNLLQELYLSGRECEHDIRKIVREVFPGLEIALDYSLPRKLQFRVGNNFSELPADPRDARHVFEHCDRLDDNGDGLRAFVGLVTALKSLKRAVFLIDEPEAFLHPPQAFRIGQLIASEASGGKQIIVATHSADVLRGIIFSSSTAQIIRLARSKNINVARKLEGEQLLTLTNDPLLSAAGVLDGLFYSSRLLNFG